MKQYILPVVVVAWAVIFCIFQSGQRPETNKQTRHPKRTPLELSVQLIKEISALESKVSFYESSQHLQQQFAQGRQGSYLSYKSLTELEELSLNVHNRKPIKTLQSAKTQPISLAELEEMKQSLETTLQYAGGQIINVVRNYIKTTGNYDTGIFLMKYRIGGALLLREEKGNYCWDAFEQHVNGLREIKLKELPEMFWAEFEACVVACYKTTTS